MIAKPCQTHDTLSSCEEEGRSPQLVECASSDISGIARRRKIVFACRAAVIGSIGGLLLGYDLGVMSGALPIISEEFGMSVYQQELVTSLMLFGCVIGACFGGIICDRIGRKRTVYLVCQIFILGSIIMTLSHSIVTLYVGRVVIGFGVSVSAIVDISYLAEISPPEYRGAVVGTNELMITVGVLLAFMIDFSFMEVTGGWRYMFAFPIFLVITWASLMFSMPESPRWLLVKGRSEEAMRVFRLTSGGSESGAQKEFQHADASIQASRAAESFSLFNIICKQWRLSMTVSIGLMLMQQFSGHAPVITYAPELFARTGLARRTGGIATIIVGSIKVAFTLISLSVVDTVGRRTLLLIGVTGMAFSLLALSAAFDQSKNATLTSTETTVALVSVCGAVASYSLGFGPITWLVVSELFPDEIRGRTLGIATVANWTANAVMVASYLSTVEILGLQNTFVIYAVVCFVSVYLIFFYVPETHLKEVPQVQRELHQRFQHIPLLCCDCVTSSRYCCLKWGGRYSHSRVPLAVQLNYGESATVSGVSITHVVPSKLDLDDTINPGFESISEDSGDFNKLHGFSASKL